MDTVFVSVEEMYPPSTWRVAPCEKCGQPGTVRPDHPAWACCLCEACLESMRKERD